MTTYLDVMLNSTNKLGNAQAADVQNLIEPTGDVIQPKEVDKKIPEVEAEGFIAPKDFSKQAPSVVAPIKVEVENKIDPSALVESAMELNKNMFSTTDKGIRPSNEVNDSSSLRKVIREELSGIRAPLPQSKFDTSSPSQLRAAIKDELNSIIRSGGIPQLTSDSTLRSIIHNELEKTGAINKKREFVSEKIHIDESLLSPNFVEDDVHIIQLMKKDPQQRTRREELSVLGKLEDLLVDLKSTLQSGSKKKAIVIYRELHTQAQTLRFFVQERNFLFEELKLIANYLFAPDKKRPEVKKVILKESTGEITDPQDISSMDFSGNHPPVYHVTINKKGTKKVVNPKNRKVVVHSDVFGTELRSRKKKSHVVHHKEKSFRHFVENKKEVLANENKEKIFYMLEQTAPSKKKITYHKKLAKRNDFHLFSDSMEQATKDSFKAAKKRFDEITKQSTLFASSKKITPWEDKHQQMHNPLHTKNYLKALRALRQKDKTTAVNILVELHQKYPRNVAIKVRLHDALQL